MEYAEFGSLRHYLASYRLLESVMVAYHTGAAGAQRQAAGSGLQAARPGSLSGDGIHELRAVCETMLSCRCPYARGLVQGPRAGWGCSATPGLWRVSSSSTCKGGAERALDGWSARHCAWIV